MADQEEMNQRGSPEATTGARRMTGPPVSSARANPVPRRPFQCAVFVALFAVTSVTCAAASGAVSFDTGHTITKVRTASLGGRTMIVGSGYEGEVLALSADGKPLWKNELSGFMNHDLWCEDISGDDVDEILTANADGYVYCLDAAGELLWQFRPNEVPMYSVCVVHQGGRPLVVCGGFDNSIYYLSATGEKIKEIRSTEYSIAKPWGRNPLKPKPPEKLHVANFLRKIVHENGSETLVVHGTMNGMQDKGVLYLFDPLADKPLSTTKVNLPSVVGELRVVDDGSEILLGTSGIGNQAAMARFNTNRGEFSQFKLSDLKRRVDGFGYRVVQPVKLPEGDSFRYLMLFGSQIVLMPADMDATRCEVLSCKYSFNDMWMDRQQSTLLLASCQSGGSCIHRIDLKNANWKRAYSELTPPGKIAAILKASGLVRERLKTFKRPDWERHPATVYLMTEAITDEVESLVDTLKKTSNSPVFLNGRHLSKVEDWDRSAMENDRYREKRDQRKNYALSHQEAVAALLSRYEDHPGTAFWGGHGNDPYMFSLDTVKKVIDGAGGKKTVLIYPELEDHSEDFAYVMEHHFYPLAEYAQGKNANIFVRTKHCFWQGNIYLPMWRRVLSGEFADVFIPAMEETSDKSMELSLAGRLGIWTSGSTESWGTRCARDNPSFDRSRQHSHQMLPNHFLRTMVYHLSCGARYVNNFPVDQQYMSLLWVMIAKGALYVPRREEIVSFSPVHLSMHHPDHDYMLEGSNVKWCTFFDAQRESERPMVFSRLNGSWPGAPVTDWDFSRYAAGVRDRRLNFLPPYENGLVLITPPQGGALADKDPPRGALRDHMHPIYKSILKEHYTDGRHYLSADGKQKLPADQHYRQVESDIKQGARLLPLTVSGDVAWVAAQTSPTHLRLTIIDGGYINPKTRKATVIFQKAQPERMVDVLFSTEFDVSNPASVSVTVPCGMFRFIDVELKQPLSGS